MPLLLFITTSNGVYVLDDSSGESRCVLGNKHTPGFFKKKARGYFGITLHKKSGKIIVASRERLGTKKHNKPTTDTKLHFIDPGTFEHEHIATVMDLHDVHQITSDDQFVYLSDTGKNRVIVYDLIAENIHRIINIGDQRDDINHINAVRVLEDRLHIGMNNRGRESEILTLPIDTIIHHDQFEFDALEFGSIRSIKNVMHSHDLEPCNGTILCCSSADGWVLDASNSDILIDEDDWVRGLTTDGKHLWLGASMLANRKQRHSKSLNGSVHKYNLSDYSLVASYKLNESGQINDLINVLVG